jgi:hypothetical protein
MRNFLRTRPRLAQAGWLLPLVLLALPNCILNAGPSEDTGEEEVLAFDPGDDPRSSAILCDIPKVPAPEANECANGDDIASGIAFNYAAIALRQGEGMGNSLGLEYSPGAFSTCGDKIPKRVEFHGPYPEGLQICLNCEQILKVYETPTAACVAKCVDLTNAGENQPADGAQAFCEANARVSTNFKDNCIEGACSMGGTPVGFEDKRRQVEDVVWDIVQGDAEFVGKDLVKAKETDMVPDNWDAGGSSKDQIITTGDAWIEFEVTEETKSHVLGVASGAGPDMDAGLADIDFAISLNFNGQAYILEKDLSQPEGVLVTGPLVQYLPGDRFRIRITDNHDGTASLSAGKVNDPDSCKPGVPCLDTQIGTQTKPSLSYPLRITATFREANATLREVTLVRIQ